MKLFTRHQELEEQSPFDIYTKLRGTKAGFIFESSTINEQLGRLSMVGFDPVMELSGKNDTIRITGLNDRIKPYFDLIKTLESDQVKVVNESELEIIIAKKEFSGAEKERFKRENIAQVLKRAISSIEADRNCYAGFYGALGYSFVNLFEDIEGIKDHGTPDFHLYFFDNIIFHNHLTGHVNLYCSRISEGESNKAVDTVYHQLLTTNPTETGTFSISNATYEPNDADFREFVEEARELSKKGELMEMVLSRKLSAKFEGDPLALYKRYSELNPSPYMFYFDFLDEKLIGTSPEMMVRYERGKVTLRPISGTAKRGPNPIEEHSLMIDLLNSEKEKSELDMLVDLARNDLARVCKPNVQIESYRAVEKYSHVMHTVAQVSGELKDDLTGVDALLACMNAGTLTGAPKMAAMKHIERIETLPRGYYGGAVGYMLVNGNVNTAITIRTAHLVKDVITYQAGATLLYESNAEDELQETVNKMSGFLQVINENPKS
jgi:anthranilate synthase component 1